MQRYVVHKASVPHECDRSGGLEQEITEWGTIPTPPRHCMNELGSQLVVVVGYDFGLANY